MNFDIDHVDDDLSNEGIEMKRKMTYTLDPNTDRTPSF